MDNGVGTFEGSGLGEQKGFKSENFELKVEKIDMEGLSETKDLEGDEVFEEASDVEVTLVEKMNVGDSFVADTDRISVEHEVDKFEEAVEEHSYEMEEAVNVETADNGVEKEADRDELTPSGTDRVVDNGKDVVKEVPELVTASVGVSEYGSGDSKDSTVVIEGSEIGFPSSNNQKEDQSLILEPSDDGIISKHEPQLHDIKKVDVNEEGEGALSHFSEKKNDISGKNDKDLKMSEIYETSTHRQYDINEDLNNVPDGSKCDEKADMVEDLVDIVSDDGIDVKSSGVALQNWQNGVSFSKVLNSNGFAGVEHDSQLQETGSTGEKPNRKDNGKLNNLHQDDNNKDLEDILTGKISVQQAERPSKEVGNLKMEVIADSTSGLEEESPARLGKDRRNVEEQDEKGPQKDLSVTSHVENDQIEGAASHVEKSLDHSVTSQKNASVETTNLVTAKTEKDVLNTEQVKQNTRDIRRPGARPVVPVPASVPAAAPAPTPAPTHPAGLGRAAPLLEPSSRVVSQTRANGTGSHTHNQVTEESANGDAEENDETREKLQMIRVKFLRLAHRLGQTPHNVVVAQVLYRLGLAEQLRGGNGGRVGTFSFDRASAMAEQLESVGQEPLDFSCTIMVLGKTGVGKSATINSIFDEMTFGTDAFQLGTKKVQDVVGTVQGIRVRVIDTPGLFPSWSDQHRNEKILQSVRRFIKKSPPDIVLYLDRLDMQSRDSGDMPLLRTITDTFGPSIWFNAIVVLTHAASAPPEGPNGVATSYDMFVTQRSHVVQQAIRHAAGDMRLMNPVSLVENHSACRTNRAGQRVLPNGQVWKPHLLLLSFASKILAEANTLLKLQDGPPGKPFTARARAPPLPFLLTSLLRSRPQLKLPHEQYDDDDDTLDDDLDPLANSDNESEYDDLPPFKNLTRAQLAELSKSQRKAYYDELEYREKLFMKKQLREEKQRRRMMKKMAATANDMPAEYSNGVEEETGSETSVPVAMADLPLPASFDSDNPTHRYRFLDTTNQWLVRPVHDSHSWDHDVGYEGVNMERSFVIRNKVPMSFSGQVTKDKKEAHFQMEVAGTVKHAEGKATTLGFDMQQIGKDIAYTLRTDTKFSNFRRNKGTASLSVTHMGDAVTAGLKMEDKLIVTRRAQIVMSGGAIAGRGDVAYGGSLEATLKDKDFPLGRFLTTMSVSLMDWHGDLATGWNAQTQIPVGRSTNLIGSVNLNNRGQGQVSVRLNSSDQLQIALVALVPLLRKLFCHSPQIMFEY